MRTKWIITLLAAVTIVGALSLVSRADQDEKDKDKHDETEKPTTLDKIPAAAKAAILKEAGANKVVKVCEEIEKNETYYEAQYKDGGKMMEVKVDAKGKLLEKEETDDDHDEKDKDKKKD